MSGSDSNQMRQADNNTISLLYLQITEQSAPVLQNAAHRIVRNVRRSDSVLLLERVCAVVLPGTPLLGAEVVARRLSSLLVDIEYELQVLYGNAALTLLQRLRSEHATEVREKSEFPVLLRDLELRSSAMEKLPYLAFLSSYPPRRLLQLFPYELACRYQCVPVGAERGVLTLASCQSLNTELLSHFQALTQYSIFQVRCEVTIVNDVLHHWRTVAPVQARVGEGR